MQHKSKSSKQLQKSKHAEAKEASKPAIVIEDPSLDNVDTKHRKKAKAKKGEDAKQVIGSDEQVSL